MKETKETNKPVLNVMKMAISGFVKNDLLNPDTIEQQITALNNYNDKMEILSYMQDRARELKIKTLFDRVVRDNKLDIYESKESKKLKPNEMSDLLHKNNIYKMFQNECYIYKNNSYNVLDDMDIEREIIKHKEDALSGFRKETLLNLKLKAENIDFRNKTFLNTRENYISYQNGLLNLKTRKLEEHNPDMFFINQIPHSYTATPVADDNNALATCLKELSCNDESTYTAILQMIGYCQTNKTNIQKCFFLYGSGANGKSTLLEIIRATIGQDNISDLSFKDMTGDNSRFRLSQIENKILNISGEMTTQYAPELEHFKKLTGEDEILIERKHKEPKTIKPYAKFIFNANELPRVADKSKAFYRRLNIIEMKASFTDEQKARFNIKNILTDDNIEWLINKSITAYLDMPNNHFANEKQSDELVSIYRLENSTALQYLESDSFYKMYEVQKMRTFREIYLDYANYCKYYGYEKSSLRNFQKEIEDSNLYTIERPRYNNKRYVIIERVKE